MSGRFHGKLDVRHTAQEPCGVPASSQAQPHAAGGDRRANPSSDLFAPPIHPLADTEPARRAPPAAKRVNEPQATAGGMEAVQAAAGLERLLAALQAKARSRPIHDLICCICMHGCC